MSLININELTISLYQLSDSRNKNNHNNYFMKKSVIASNKVLN